jgi:hypothetical protein
LSGMKMNPFTSIDKRTGCLVWIPVLMFEIPLN